MDTREFEAQLRRDGYLDIKHKWIEPAVATHNHSHLFDTRLLVVEGEATITCGAQQRTYRAGEVMEIESGVEHSEQYERVRFIVGLRHKPVEPSDKESAMPSVNRGQAS